jgi:hypothetical protein
MVVIGLVIFAIAVAAAIVAIAQNQSTLVDVHVFGYHWTTHSYWVLVAGLVIAAVGLFGLAMMRSGTAHAARMRVERRGLVRENARLTELASDQPVVVAPAAAPTTYAEPVQRQPVETVEDTDDSGGRRHHLFHRSQHASNA